MARGRGERSQTAAAFESTEKTAPGSGFLLLNTRSNTLGREQALVEDDIVGRRDAGDADLDSATLAGDVGIPVDVDGIGWWLKALLGAPSTTDSSGVYTHVFSSGAWSLPSFSVEKQLPDVPSFEMFRGARAGQFRMSLQRGGRVNATVSVIAQAVDAPGGSTAAGTPGDYDLSRFMQAEATAEIGGTAMANLVSAEVDYNNNLDPVDLVTGDQFIGGLDPMRASLSGSLRVRFDSESLFTTAKAGTAIALDLILSKSASASLTLSMPRVFLAVASRPIDGPGGIEATFNYMAARATDDSAMLTATLINEVASY